ncbi:S26 family signal peptidase [Bacillus ndiopicus]|uniref:hypothetical protein n=1 Tax=Bacillus ndiopicus TaxID=1347368 RepID=UPI0006932C8F|nr:hypothetical protein [Bacillus ndiopicus]
MNQFKKQLQSDLQRKVPFTNELKNRIIHNEKTKSSNRWRLIPVYISLAAIVFFLLSTINKSDIQQVVEENATILKPDTQQAVDKNTTIHASYDKAPSTIYKDIQNAPLINGEHKNYFRINSVNRMLVFTVENTGANPFTWKIYKPNNEVWYNGSLAPNQSKSYIIDDKNAVAIGEYHLSVISRNGGPGNVSFTIKEKESLLPILNEGKHIVDVEYSDFLGDSWMLYSPLIIDENASITYGDYIVYYGKNGLAGSTVLGLPGDEVVIEQGRVLVNNEELQIHGLNKKIDKMTQDNPMTNPYFFHRKGEATDRFIDQKMLANENEWIIYNNEGGHTILNITNAQIAGKVIGVQKFEPTFELNTEEKALYEAFKASHNLELLRNIAPLTIAKIYIVAEMEQEYSMYKALFTTIDDEETREVRDYIKKAQPVREAYFTKEIEQLGAAKVFAGLETGEFIQQSEDYGTITFFSSIDGMETRVTMRKNDKGIWQPAFSRPIY